jgi:general secretion pathway protein D
MVFIHTTVLRDDDNYSAASKEKYDQIRVRQSSAWKRKSSVLLSRATMPSCPRFLQQALTPHR